MFLIESHNFFFFLKELNLLLIEIHIFYKQRNKIESNSRVSTPGLQFLLSRLSKKGGEVLGPMLTSHA